MSACRACDGNGYRVGAGAAGDRVRLIVCRACAGTGILPVGPRPARARASDRLAAVGEPFDRLQDARAEHQLEHGELISALDAHRLGLGEGW